MCYPNKFFSAIKQLFCPICKQILLRTHSNATFIKIPYQTPLTISEIINEKTRIRTAIHQLSKL